MGDREQYGGRVFTWDPAHEAMWRAIRWLQLTTAILALAVIVMAVAVILGYL